MPEAIRRQKQDLMKKKSLLALNSMNVLELQKVQGGYVSSKVCGCVCVGPVSPSNGQNSSSMPSSSQSEPEDCADCGASNAHRVINN